MHVLTSLTCLVALAPCLSWTLIDDVMEHKHRLHPGEDLFVFPSMHMGEDDVKVTYRGEPPSDNDHDDLDVAASDVTPAPRRRGVESTWNPDSINSTVNPNKMRKAATPASVYASHTKAAPRPTPASLLEIVSPSSTTTEATTTASTTTEATTRVQVSLSTAASTTVPSTAATTKKTDIRSIWVRSSAQTPTSTASTSIPSPAPSQSPSPTLFQSSTPIPFQSPTPTPWPFPSSTPGPTPASTPWPFPSFPSSTPTPSPWPFPPPSSTASPASPSVSTEFNAIASSSDFQSFEKQKEKFSALQDLLKHADAIKPEISAPVTPRQELNQHDEYDYVYNDDEVIVPRDTAKLLDFPHFPDRAEADKDFGQKDNANPAQTSSQVAPSPVPSSVPIVQASTTPAGAPNPVSSTTPASASLFSVNSSPFPSFPARDTPHSIFGQGYSVIVPPDGGVQDNTVTAAPQPVTVSQLPPRPTPFPTFSVTPSPSTTVEPVTPVTPIAEDNNGIGQAPADESENSARVPRDFSASQIQLQTPSSVSVHHSSLISHPSPQGQAGLGGPNSYQSITIIHPNKPDPDNEREEAVPPPHLQQHHDAHPPYLQQHQEAAPPPHLQQYQEAAPPPHLQPHQQPFLPNQIMLHTTASPLYGHNEQTTEAVVLSLPNIRPTDIPEGYELIPLDKLTPSDEIVPWDEAKQVLNVSVSALGAPKVHPLHQVTTTVSPFLEDVPRVHPNYEPPPITHFDPPHIGVPKHRSPPSLVSQELHHSTPLPHYPPPTETPQLYSPEYQPATLPPWATRPPTPSSSTLQSLVSSTTITPHGERHAPASLSSPAWLAFPPQESPVPSLWPPTTSPTTTAATTTTTTTTTAPPLTVGPFTAFSPVPPALDYSYKRPGYSFGSEHAQLPAAPPPNPGYSLGSDYPHSSAAPPTGYSLGSDHSYSSAAPPTGYSLDSDHAHLPPAPPPKPEWPQAPPISPDLPPLYYDESPKSKDPVEEEKSGPPLVVKSLPKSYGQVIHFGSDFSPQSSPSEGYDVSKPGPYFKSINVFYDNVNAGPTTAHPDVKAISLTTQKPTAAPSLHHFTPIHVPNPASEGIYSTPPPPSEEKNPHVADVLYYPYGHDHIKPTPTPLLPHPATTPKPRPIQFEPEVGGQFDLPPPRPEFVASYLQTHHTTPKPDYFATSYSPSTFSPRKVPALPDLLMKPPPANGPHLPHQLPMSESPSLYAYPSYGGGSYSPPPVVKSLSRTPHPKRSYDPGEIKHLLSADPFGGQQHNSLPDFYTSPQPVFRPATTAAPVDRPVPVAEEEELPEASDLRMQQLRKYLASINDGDPSTLLDQTVLKRLLNMLEVSTPVSTSTSRSDDVVSSTTEFYTTPSTTTTPATTPTPTTTAFTTASPTFTTTFPTTTASPTPSLYIPRQTYISQNTGLAPNGHVLSLHDNESGIWGPSNQDDGRVSELARMLSSMQKKMRDFEQLQQLKQAATESPTEMLTQMTHTLDNLMTVVHGLNTTVVEAASKMSPDQQPQPQQSRTLDYLQDKLMGLTAKVNSLQERQEKEISKEKVREVLLEVVNEMRNVNRLRHELEEEVAKPSRKKAKPTVDLPPVKKSISPSNFYVLPAPAPASPSMASSPLNRTAINVYANSLLLVPGSYAMSTTARPYDLSNFGGMWHPSISPALMQHAQPRGLVSAYPVHLADASGVGQSGLGQSNLGQSGLGQSGLRPSASGQTWETASGQTVLSQTGFGQTGLGQSGLGLPTAKVGLNVMSDLEQRDAGAKRNLFATASAQPDPYILQSAPIKRGSSQLEMIMYPSGQLLKASDLEPSASTAAPPRLALPESPPVGMRLPHYVLTTKRRSDAGPEENNNNNNHVSLLPQLMRTARDDIKLVGNVIKLALS